jgi:hypothetical protein
VATAYVANAVSGFVTVVDVDALELVTNIPVTLTPDGQTGLDLLHTLQVPIQTPVSPDEKWVATAVLGLTNVPTVTGAADHVAIIDTHTNTVVKIIPTPAGTHGVNWGAKLGGGYYAYVTNQHANVLTIIDPDPNFDGDASDAAVVGTILLANGSPGAGVTDGTGGQGIKPLPLMHDGWIQPTVALSEAGATSPEVDGWLAQLTDDQRNPEAHHGLHLSVDDLVGGTDADFTVEGAVPGLPAYFLYRFAGAGDGPCFAELGGQCLGLLAPFEILASPLADVDGHAGFAVSVPLGLPAISVHLQVAVPAGTGGDASLLSEVVTKVTGS